MLAGPGLNRVCRTDYSDDQTEYDLISSRFGAHMRRLAHSALILAIASSAMFASSVPALSEDSGNTGPLHFAVNVRRDVHSAAAVGFNLIDVGTMTALAALPEGMKGIYWLGNGYNTTCGWQTSDAEVRKIVAAIKDNPKFSGIYYISDEPHPSICRDAPARVAERSAMIHALDARAKTFIVVLNGSADATEFARMKDSADYIGVDPYPCNLRNEQTGCDYRALERKIDQAFAAGILASRIVPVFQAFGQNCAAKDQYYRLPSAAETRKMLAIWDAKVPVGQRPFDMTYSWGAQKVACPALSTSQANADLDLKPVYSTYFSQSRAAAR